ncbi:MAG: hypothetical protein GC129_04305 [Proteobacteria bacterium]|nr:hypothetical protein [Pseudomonadota bacterium]
MPCNGGMLEGVRFVQLPSELDKNAVMHAVAQVEYLCGQEHGPVVLLCDAKEGKLVEAMLEPAQKLFALRERLVTVVEEYAPPAATWLFAMGLARAAPPKAMFGLQDVELSKDGLVSDLKRRLGVLDSSVQDFCEKIIGTDSTTLPFAMDEQAQKEEMQRRKEAAEKRVKAHRQKVQAEIADLRKRLAKLEPRQRAFIDMFKQNGASGLDDPRYWGGRGYRVEVDTAMNLGLVNHLYREPFGWMGGLGLLPWAAQQQEPRRRRVAR